ncbi:MAG: HAMP domain-containing sensor histidine kinase [Gemmatimonadaceae bacterium]
MHGRRWLVAAALFTPVLLLAVVTAMTWRAERTYAQVTDRVVHDYAAIAAWQYARRASEALHDEVMAAFLGCCAGHMRLGAAPRLASPHSLLATRPDTASAFLGTARLAFTWDASSGRTVYASDADVPGVQGMIERRLAGIAASRHTDGEPHHMLFDTAAGRPWAIALWTIAGPRDLRGAYGVVSDPATLRARFAAAITDADLLPATSGAPRLAPTDMAVRLTRRDGGVVFATPLAPGSTAATDSTGLQNGELRVTIDLSPRLARALLAHTPSTQLPALLLMFAVALGLAVVGLRQDRRARELDALRGRFVANVSHELRTPLAQISMFGETLALGRERGDAERRRFAEIIVAEARRLTTLVESVLRLERGTRAHALIVKESSLNAELAAAVDAYEPIARSTGARIVYDDAADVRAPVDPGAFRQVVLNLLDNAVKHGGRSGEVRVMLRSRAGLAEIVVDDAGPGIPEQERERVFEPFVRLEGGGSGTGIGLAVVRDLVHAHGGTVRVERSPEGGARFLVTLPATQGAAANEPVNAGA